MSNVNKALQKKREQISNSTELLLSKTRDWQVIKQFLMNRINKLDLTNTQLKKLERYQFIYNQLVSGRYTEQDVLHTVMNTFNIEMSQAIEDLNSSKEVYAWAFNVNKRFELKTELEILKDMRRKAKEVNDFEAATKLSKVIVMVLQQIPDDEPDLAGMFEGHDIEAVFDPKLLNAPDVNMEEILKSINAKRKVKIKTELFTDIDHEEVKPNEEKTSL